MALAFPAAVFLWVYIGLWSFIHDDVFISARYAKHLAEGVGLVYNPGERVEGYTNFLYTVLLAFPFVLKLPLIPFIKLANVMFAFAAAAATWKLAHGTLLPPDRGPLLALAPAAMFMLTAPVIISAAQGLETMMFTMLLVLSIALFFDEARRDGFPWSAVCFAALAMTRPDGAVFAPWVWLMGLLGGWPPRSIARFAWVFFGLYGAYFAGRLGYYHHWLPNTFYAKKGDSGAYLHRGWKELVREGWIWVLIPAALVAARRSLAAVMLIGVVALRIVFQLWSGGPSTGGYRFLVPILPFVYILAMAGTASLIRSSAVRRAAIGLVGIAMLVPGWLAYPGESERALAYGHGLKRAHLEFGRRVNARTAKNAVIAMGDAGLGPLMADRENIDMMGLNDFHIAHLSGPFGKMDPQYVLGRKPDLIVLISYVPRPAGQKDFHLRGDAMLFADPEFGDLYGWSREYEFAPDYHLVVYRRMNSMAVPPDF